MNFLISIAFGAGIAAFAYNKFVRRVGYSNTQSVVTITGVIFILATIIFFTIIETITS